MAGKGKHIPIENKTETNKRKMGRMKPMSIVKEREAAGYSTIESTSKITSKGQITVPVEIRNALQVKEGDQLRFVLKEGVVIVEPVRYLSADELFGIFDKPEDQGNFILDLDAARNYRANEILKKSEVLEE